MTRILVGRFHSARTKTDMIPISDACDADLMQ